MLPSERAIMLFAYDATALRARRVAYHDDAAALDNTILPAPAQRRYALPRSRCRASKSALSGAAPLPLA